MSTVVRSTTWAALLYRSLLTRTCRTTAIKTKSSPCRLAQRGHHFLQTKSNPSSVIHRPFTSTANFKIPLPSTERNLKTVLDLAGHDKFGFVIYRTSYSAESDVLWPRFQQLLQDRARLLIADSDTPELLGLLSYRFVDDRTRLDGASVTTLRNLFDAWRRSPEARAEQPHAVSPVYPSFTPRYNYFVRADAEVLRSVAQDAPKPPGLDFDGEGFVDFIDANWESAWDGAVPEGARYPPLEGCEEENVGWMRLASWMMATDAYDTFSTDSIWYALYQRPPQVVNH